MKTTKTLFNLLVSMLLVGALGCSNNSDVETQIVTEIIQVPFPDPQGQPVSINVDASSITGELSHNNDTFPESIYESGEISLKQTNSDTVFFLTSTQLQSYSAMVVNGSYDFQYHYNEGGIEVPVNVETTVLSDIDVAADATIDVAVSSVSITPVFTLNGGSFPGSQYDRADFYLQPVGSTELIFLGESHINNQAVRVTAGDYHVIYDYVQGSVSPINQRTRVMANVDLTQDQQLAIDISAGPFRSIVTLNGNNFPVSQYNHGELFLQDPATLAETFIMKTYDSGVIVNAILSTYNVLYKAVDGSTVPVNASKVILENFVVDGSTALIEDIISYTVDLNPTLNGAPFQVSEYQDGNLALYDAQTQSYSDLGNTHGSFDSIEIIAGSYDVTFTHETGNLVPQNIQAVVASGLMIDAEETHDIDIIAHTVTTNVTMDGESFSGSQYQKGQLFLRDLSNQQDILVTTTNAQNESILVLAGSYDFYYQHADGADVPQNTHLVLQANQQIAADTQLSSDISTAYIEVSATLNNQAFPQSIYQTADIFAAVNPGDEVFVLSTHVAGDAVKVATGDYQFYYQHVDGNNVPLNGWVLIDSQTINPPPQ